MDQLFNDKEVYDHRLFLHYADLDDVTTIRRILTKTEPDELYHLAGQSHVGASFEIPETTCQFTAMGTLKLLEIVRDLANAAEIPAHQQQRNFWSPGRLTTKRSNADAAGHAVRNRQSVRDPNGKAVSRIVRLIRLQRDLLQPRITASRRVIRDTKDHPRRGRDFARTARQIEPRVSLDAKRDWGYAPEYVDAMWRMLQQDVADDFVVATGTTNSVEDFLDRRFRCGGT